MADQNQQEKEFSIQPIDDTNKDQGKGFIDAIKSKVAPHVAAPGPAQSHDHSQIPQEGTKEERLAKAKEINK
ncbi:hypothetical protein M406DRAFT_62671 [Cryphonectria parasitica EP155]|uniref:Uncharacterized protein n=1 Tax=Cryphonectria parasitica (strain ATCC 38755 / EP155) TaxID=660469 RepID=A0A9P4Y7U8_CRYP1|nr:uncharacterized protein M406DRAFT_62671 [Cryphonectria parasitica EP155]KAF3768532.1 hypothetical protein M406DRAFT_62671 [Cryphonectria parasitica EP155]